LNGRGVSGRALVEGRPSLLVATMPPRPCWAAGRFCNRFQEPSPMIVLARSRYALRHVRYCALFMVAASMGLSAQAAEPASLARLAPESATAYAEIAQPQALVETARETRWQTLLGQNDKWQT